jgi:hypothetical protein
VLAGREVVLHDGGVGADLPESTAAYQMADDAALGG